jgi:ribose/xylose/arabinose/galactoside ABC-type transport system permease subunit
MQVAVEEKRHPLRARLGRARRWIADYPNATSLLTTFLLLVALVLIFYGISERFLSLRNIVIVLNQSAAYVILGVGMTFVITTKGIDLSVGSMVALVGSVMGVVMVSWGQPVWLALIAGVVTGALAGLFNGLCVARFRVPPLIVTLGTMALFRGLAYVMLGHQILFRFPQEFVWVARARIFGLAPSVYIAALIAIWGYFFLNQTRTGQHITAVGGNEEAARLAGIPVRRTKFLVYFIMGVLTSIASAVWLARLNSVQAALAYGVEFHTIALVVLGGTSLFGGRGLVMGSVMGALILAVLENGLVLSGLTAFVQQVMLGLIFITVVAFRTLQFREGQVTR